MIKSFWYQSKNIGDTLTPVIVKHFTGQDVLFANRNDRDKLLAVGSIMKALRIGDTVWGTGVMRETDKFPNAGKCKFLAVRGKLTEKILGVDVGVYGDPALLLPLIYNPDIKKTHPIGIIPHYIEKNEEYWKTHEKGGNFMINVEQDWKTFIDQVLSCEKIYSSSLHGIIIAEAYGIPATWVKLTDKVIGNGFKFNDYLTSTGRKSVKIYDEFCAYPFEPIDKELLKEIQIKLIKALKENYENNQK